MTHKVILENGLTVVIEHMPHLPVAAIQCGFKIGSIYEKPDEAGICHLIEHMLFKGTTKRPKAGVLAYDAESIGADINAFTSFENTVYHLTLASRYFKQGLEILADLVTNPLFDADELEREKEVVCEEIRRGNDQPSRVLSELLFKTAYRKHPYRLPIIGTQKHVKGFPASKLKAFYKKWYGAKNAVVVVVSDIPVKEVLAAVTRAFSSFHEGNPVYPVLPKEPSPARRMAWKKQAIEGSYFDLAWPIPDFLHPDTPALDLLSHVLGEGDASRLETTVKERDHLVQSIYSYAYTPSGPGLFVVGGLGREADLKKAINASLAEIERLKDEGVDEAAFARARLNLESDRYYEKQTVDGVARKLMFFECMTGDFKDEAAYYGNLSALTARDVTRVLRDYLAPEHLSVAVVSSGESSLVMESIVPKSIRPVKTKAKQQAIKSVKTVGDLSLYRLPNGVRVLTRMMPGLPILSLKAGMYGGLIDETPDTNGIFNVMSRVMTKGTAKRSYEDIALDSERIAGGVDGFSGRHAIGVSAHFLSSQTALGLDLTFDILKNPKFAPDQFKREQFLVLEALRQERDYPTSVLWKTFSRALFPMHPYGLPSSGDVTSVGRLTADTVKQAYQNHLSADSLILSLVGDFEPARMLSFLTEHIGDLKSRGALRSNAKIALDPKPARSIVKEITLKKEQAHIALGFQGPNLGNPDRHALALLNTVLAGQGGRLFLQLRDRESLAYTVTSYLMEGRDPGFFAVYIACDPRKVDQAICGMRRELERVVEKPIARAELSRAKHQLICGYEMDLQRYGSVAQHLFAGELYGLPLREYYDIPKRYEHLTVDDVQRVARRYLDLNHSVLCVLKP